MREDIRILLVDDSESTRILFSRNLKYFGYSQIQEGVNGQDAINLLLIYKPNLILMDTQMPGMDGYEVCRKIRQEDYGKEVAIIGMSDGQYKEKWLEAGADDFLHKKTFSLKGDALDAKIQEVFKKHQPLHSL